MHVVAVEPELLTRAEAARFLNIGEASLRRWYAAGRGPAVVKYGTSRASRVRYPRVELLEFARNPAAYSTPARPDNVPHFEPPARGNPRRRKRPVGK